jgi:hypothetical protein
MATRKECDQYAAELNERFDEMVRWAITNWPRKEFPLLQSDFMQSRRELSGIIGPKLGDGEPDLPILNPSGPRAPFVSMNPMPWP